MGGHVFVFIIDVNFDPDKSDPSCRVSPLPRTRRWGKRAMALMLWCHVCGWHWQGGKKEKERGLLVLEGKGPNDQHEWGERGSGGKLSTMMVVEGKVPRGQR
jgi:hypothetical protein